MVGVKSPSVLDATGDIRGRNGHLEPRRADELFDSSSNSELAFDVSLSAFGLIHHHLRQRTGVFLPLMVMR
jgi:hypothetical protein